MSKRRIYEGVASEEAFASPSGSSLEASSRAEIGEAPQFEAGESPGSRVRVGGGAPRTAAETPVASPRARSRRTAVRKKARAEKLAKLHLEQSAIPWRHDLSGCDGSVRPQP